MQFIRKLRIWLLAIGACGLSVYLTVRFCSQMAAQTIGMAAIALGIVWELAKYTFASESKIRGSWGLSLLSIGLVIGSMAASIGFFGDATTARTESSTAFKAEQSSMEARIIHASMLRENAKLDMERGYRSRALKALSEAESLQTVADEKTDALLSQTETTDIHYLVYLILAIALEVIAIVSLRMCHESKTIVKERKNIKVGASHQTGTVGGAMHQKPELLTRVRETNNEKPNVIDSVTSNEQPVTKNTSQSELHQDPVTKNTSESELLLGHNRVAKFVKSKPKGEPLRYREIREELSLGNEQVKKAIYELAEQGVVTKKGRDWVRV